MSETNVEGKYKSVQTGKRPRRVWTTGGILPKLSILIDNNRVVLTAATLIAIYILSGWCCSIEYLPYDYLLE